MKKLLAFLLALTMVFCLCACDEGGKDKDDDKKSRSNTFETPIALEYEFRNAGKVSDPWDAMLTMLNGCVEDELRALVKAYEDSEEFQDRTEDLKEEYQDYYDELKDTYGDNYKFTYEIDGEKVEMEEQDLDAAQQRISDQLDYVQFLLEEYSEDEELKDSLKVLEDLAKALEDLKVEEGYYLTIAESVSGSEVSEEEAEEATLLSRSVYKIGGHWVYSDTLFDMLQKLTDSIY